MPKFRLLVDIDSMVEEGEHLEDIFADGIEAETEEEAERIVSAKVKELMYGGPYYSIVEDEDDEDPAVNKDKHQGREDVHSHLDARDHHLIKPNLKKMTGGK